LREDNFQQRIRIMWSERRRRK